MDVGSMAVAERVARDVTITSERRDRARDIVRVAGGLFDDYVRNPVVLLNHDPVWVGTARSLRARPLSTGVPSIGADIVWSRGVLGTQTADLWDEGVAGAVSIGFTGDGPDSVRVIGPDGLPAEERHQSELRRALKSMERITFRKFIARSEDEVGYMHDGCAQERAVRKAVLGDGYGLEFLRWHMLELSVACVPMNPDTVARMRSVVAVPRAVDLGAATRGGWSSTSNMVPLPDGGNEVPEQFDPGAEPLEPSEVKVAWAARFLGLPVHDVAQTGVTVPGARVGSFLYSLREVLAADGLMVRATRNILEDGTEAPPVYRAVQLSSARSDSFMVSGVAFLSGIVEGEERRLVLDYRQRWSGQSVAVFAATSASEYASSVMVRADDLMRGRNNFLRGEAFALGGGFIPRTGETWADVFIEARNTAALSAVVDRVNRDRGETPSRGVLLLGPPGTGKTLCGRVMRNTVDATFIWVSARDFYQLGSFGGVSTAMELARELAPTILFVEDVDNWLDKYTVDLLKTEMDGIGRHVGVVTVLTTNEPERLPAALIDRPGRFHDVLNFALPSPEVRGCMLDAWLPGLSPAVRAEVVVATLGYSGAHLRELARYAADLAGTGDGGSSVDAAARSALAKLREQREVIAAAQNRERGYRPPTEHVADLEATVAAGRGCAAVLRAARPAPPPALGAHGARLDAAFAALRECSVEVCPECCQAVAYHRPSRALARHEVGGMRCDGKAIDGDPRGLTFKRFADLLGEHLLHDVGAAAEAYLDRGIVRLPLDMALGQLMTRVASAARCVAEMKAGRVVSSANRQRLMDARDGCDEAVTALGDVREMIGEMLSMDDDKRPDALAAGEGDAPPAAEADAGATLAAMMTPEFISALADYVAQET